MFWHRVLRPAPLKGTFLSSIPTLLNRSFCWWWFNASHFFCSDCAPFLSVIRDASIIFPILVFTEAMQRKDRFHQCQRGQASLFSLYKIIAVFPGALSYEVGKLVFLRWYVLLIPCFMQHVQFYCFNYFETLQLIPSNGIIISVIVS